MPTSMTAQSDVFGVRLTSELTKRRWGSAPTHSARQGTAWKGHFSCICYQSLFVFNQFGHLERCALRPGNVQSADGWEAVFKPVIARYAALPGRRRLRHPGITQNSKGGGLFLRHTASRQPCSAKLDRAFAQAPGGSYAKRGEARLR